MVLPAMTCQSLDLAGRWETAESAMVAVLEKHCLAVAGDGMKTVREAEISRGATAEHTQASLGVYVIFLAIAVKNRGPRMRMTDFALVSEQATLINVP